MPTLISKLWSIPQKVYIGVDPGASGGLAMIESDSATAISMPQTDQDILDWFLANGRDC
jgi:hypothetical protein